MTKLYQEGCELVRIAVLGKDYTAQFKTIVERSLCPFVVDINFNYDFALISTDAGISKIIINFGNIGSIENIRKLR
ncbi:flavodoxin-dependent (E)-4-hydroxy-3-methylbut-2-enyl-diphosphate synthase [Spiroplasma endosymbiont of Polydrusus formosus]|uniref:flavodoxin-dependent (E)-4-hydroxy-3-methylbut-2-enyl-diphosphate synthase n=1 Tax=Spiroplasma endosymbiont of Polydrusus formosus TaxID=3139326 RepID=UPI0035B5489E